MSTAIEFPAERLIETAIDINKRRKAILVRAKAAVRAGDVQEADKLLTELVPDEEMPRTSKGKHDGAGRRRSRVVTFPADRQ
jgi:hypothetical protein